MAHKHTHNHSHACPSHSANEPRLIIAIALTGSFMIAEILAGLYAGSLALIADAGHMLTDFAALIAALIAIKIQTRARQKVDQSHLSRIPIYIALISALSLLLIAAWIIFEAYKRIQAPSPVLGTPMLIVAMLGLLVNIIVFAVLMGGDRKNLNMRGAALHVLGDILGSVAAIAAAIIIITTGYMLADPILSALVAIFISVSAMPLIKDSITALKETPQHDSQS